MEVSPDADTLSVFGELQKQGIDTGYSVLTFQGEEVNASLPLADVGIGSESIVCLKRFTVTDMLIKDCGDIELRNHSTDERKTLRQIIDGKGQNVVFQFRTMVGTIGCCVECFSADRAEHMLPNINLVDTLSIYHHPADETGDDRILCHCGHCPQISVMKREHSLWHFPA